MGVAFRTYRAQERRPRQCEAARRPQGPARPRAGKGRGPGAMERGDALPPRPRGGQGGHTEGQQAGRVIFPETGKLSGQRHVLPQRPRGQLKGLGETGRRPVSQKRLPVEEQAFRRERRSLQHEGAGMAEPSGQRAQGRFPGFGSSVARRPALGKSTDAADDPAFEQGGDGTAVVHMQKQRGSLQGLRQAVQEREGIACDEAGEKLGGGQRVEPEPDLVPEEGNADGLHPLSGTGSRARQMDAMFQEGGLKGKFRFQQEPEGLSYLSRRREGESPVPEKRVFGGKAEAHVLGQGQVRGGEAVEKGTDARLCRDVLRVSTGDAVQPEHVAAFQADPAERARERGSAWKQDETVLGKHGGTVPVRAARRGKGGGTCRARGRGLPPCP